MDKIGNKIKEIRKTRGLSQEEVAKSLNISQSAYARIETGESNSWAYHIQDICDLFEIKPEELFKSDKMVINKDNKDDSMNGYYINNNYPKELKEQHESETTHLKEEIISLKEQHQSQIKHLEEEIISLKEQYESQITHLEKEIAFLREQLNKK